MTDDGLKTVRLTGVREDVAKAPGRKGVGDSSRPDQSYPTKTDLIYVEVFHGRRVVPLLLVEARCAHRIGGRSKECLHKGLEQ
jgi:hypothetical protein